ncbi:hypothetical protein FACS189445_6170 [Spirochaetia bacterium]|nr:hypothetical protein FACS189445_6170 [Spirochaetia bacterium]
MENDEDRLKPFWSVYQKPYVELVNTYIDTIPDNPDNFDTYLQGVWVSTRDLDFWLWETEADRGRLWIGYDSITISGSIRPLDMDYPSGYTKGIALIGYSEESSSNGNEKRGTLFISDNGALKSVPYVYWRAGNEYILTLGTTPDDETFRRE